eukprot:2515656-Amphidinium_carterae.1
MTTCSPLSMRTLKQRDDVNKLKNQNTHIGQEIDTLRTVQDEWDDDAPYAEGRERQQRREEQGRARHEGTEASLRERYQALHQMVITGRRQRLEAARLEATRVPEVRAQEARPTEGRPPKAAPAVVSNSSNK